MKPILLGFHSLYGGYFDRATVAAFWLIIATVFPLSGWNCGYGLPNRGGGDGRDTNEGVAASGGRYTETSAGESNRQCTEEDVDDGGQQYTEREVNDSSQQYTEKEVNDSGGQYAEEGVDDSGGQYEDAGAIEISTQKPIQEFDQIECCSAHSAGGCVDRDVQICICEVDPKCCEESWDTVCVELVSLLGCGICEQPKLDCCTTSLASGCSDPAIQACVCTADPDCCNRVWDDVCVLFVDELGCGTCD